MLDDQHAVDEIVQLGGIAVAPFTVLARITVVAVDEHAFLDMLGYAMVFPLLPLYAVRFGADAVVISGQPGMFSGGLDVPELLPLPRSAIREFWELFFGLMRTVAASPVPVVAAITGHSPAGGAVLAIHCDYRIAAEGEFKIGFNEVKVGISVPPLILGGATRLVGSAMAERMCVEGRLLNPQQALDVGLVNEVVDADNVVEQTLHWCRNLLTLPSRAMLETRALARQDLLELFDSAAGSAPGGLERSWHTEETQSTLKALVASLKDKKKSD